MKKDILKGARNRKKISAGENGTKGLMETYPKLVAVRYYYDGKGNRFKTAEIVIDQGPIQKKRKTPKEIFCS